MTTFDVPPEYAQLITRLRQVHDLQAAAAVLHWDQATYMPPLGAEARSRQLATLTRLAHERFTDEAVGRLLERLAPWAEALPAESIQAGVVREAHRQYDRQVRIPPDLAAQLSQHSAASFAAWVKARPADDFHAVRPYLEKTLELSLRLADCFPGYAHPADPLIDFSDTGMKAAEIQNLFAALRGRLVPLADAICSLPPADDACLRQSYPVAAQLEFARSVIERFGFDFQRGRLDPTAHPFEITFALNDVRITYRAREDDLGDALFSILHEAGHALYEQGGDPALDGLPVMGGCSSGVHESQSRLWENIVGRSRPFWIYWYPILQRMFPAQLGGVTLDSFYRAVNRVERSLIRTDADEVTYNLHVMMRFDFELAMLEGSLAVGDLPEAWRERMRADLGVVPPDDRDGCLQDVHWFSGHIGGAFQGYTLGNILAAQFFAAACAAHPGIPDDIARGEFVALHGWLKDNIYRWGSCFTAPQIIQRASGGPLSIEPYLAYLRKKYGELYGIV
ncbi:MAG: carboxypeptidase M32 [Candidatus Sumerlaeia bacterium]